MVSVRTLTIIAALVVCFAPAAGWAQSGDGYDASWSTVDGGGGRSAGPGGYVVRGTFGQSDTNVLQGNDYRLSAGFWRGATAGEIAAGAGDVNCDGLVSAADLVALLLLIPSNDPGPCDRGDVNLDDVVDEGDIGSLIAAVYRAP